MRAAVGGVQALLNVSRALSLLGGVGLGGQPLGHLSTVVDMVPYMS
jgi:hypothetical protein